MGKRIDMTGKRFGRLLVLSYSHTGKFARAHWNVVCDCGNKKVVDGSSLRSGLTKSCGCLHKEIVTETGKIRLNESHPSWRKNNLTGKKFGRLTAIERTNKRSGRSVVYLCKCECGNFREVKARSLVSGGTKSCGCLHKERVAAAGKLRVGELNPSWNPNITDEERHATRMYPEYKEWRTAVFERDDYTCQKCGKKGGNLRAHHVEWYKGNEALRTELSNGVTLCNKHHRELHRLYGYDVGRENLNKFIK